jgi:hypothetical protein
LLKIKHIRLKEKYGANGIENKYCSKCSYPLVPSAFEEIKLAEESRIKTPMIFIGKVQVGVGILSSILSNKSRIYADFEYCVLRHN